MMRGINAAAMAAIISLSAAPMSEVIAQTGIAGQSDIDVTSGSPAQFCAGAGFQEWVLAIEGLPFDEFLTDRNTAAEVLSAFDGLDFGSKSGEEELRSLVTGIEARETEVVDWPGALTGVGGFSVYALTRRFVFGDELKVSGRVRDYIYDKDERRGHLAVDTRVEIIGRLTSSVHCYHWDIEVPVYEDVEPRVPDWSFDPDNPTNPFPDSMVAFPEATLQDIEDRDLKFKLTARGSGIIVRHIYRQIDTNDIERLDNTHPFYASTMASCIDLMTRDEPGQFQFELPADQSAWCLGRCAHPLVINTE